MATIANLAVQLSCNPGGLISGLDQGGKAVAALAAAYKKMSAQMSQTGAAAMQAIPGGAVIGVVDKVIGAVEAVKNFTGAAIAGVGSLGQEISQTLGRIFDQVAAGNLFAAARTGLAATTKVVQGLAAAVPYVGQILSATVGVVSSAFGEMLNWGERGLSLFKEGAARIRDLNAASTKLGISISSMSSLSMVFGGDTDKMSEAMIHFGDALAEASQKVAGTEVVFSRLGLSARELSKLPLDEAMKRYAGAFTQVAGAGQKMQSVAAVFGKRQGNQMLPLLAQGAALFDRGAAAAQRFGLSVSAIDARQVKQASMALKSVDFAIAGMKQNVAIGLAPVILEVASAFDQVGVSATAVQEWSVTGAKTLAYGGAAAVEAWKGLVIVFDTLKVGGKTMIGTLMTDIVRLLQLAAKLPSSLGGDTFKVLADDASEEIKRFFQGMDEDIKAGKQHIADFGDSFGKVDNFFARVQSRADALKKIKIAPQIKIDQRAYDLFERIQKLTVEMRTPLESFAIRMAELNEMVTEGGLGWDIYARAVGKAAGELSKTNAIKMTGAQEFGSQEAYATINNRQMQDIRADPVQRLQDAIAMQTQIQQRQLADMDLIARAVRGGKVVIG